MHLKTCDGSMIHAAGTVRCKHCDRVLHTVRSARDHRDRDCPVRHPRAKGSARQTLFSEWLCKACGRYFAGAAGLARHLKGRCPSLKVDSPAGGDEEGAEGSEGLEDESEDDLEALLREGEDG